MIKNTLITVHVILCSIWVHGAFGQTEQFKFRHLDIVDGLSHPETRTIFKDSRGFVWIGTVLGLNRFDGYTVRPFLHDPRDTTSLIDNAILHIFETPEGLLGVSTRAGLTLYNSESETFERRLEPFYARYGTSRHLNDIVRAPDGSFWFVEPHRLIKYLPEENKSVVIRSIEGDPYSIAKDSISDFSIGRNGNPWIVHSNGLVEKIIVENGQGRVAQRINDVYELNNRKQTNYRILSDAAGDLWFCAPPLNQGVFYYTVKDSTLHHLAVNSRELPLNANLVSGFVEAMDGSIWIGTDHGGINIVDKKQFGVRYVEHRDGDARSIAGSSINCLYKDDQGIIWIGTYKRGVSYYHEDIYPFELYKHYSLDPGSLPFEDINRFVEDAKGNLWIGTNGGGLLYFNRQNRTFKQYRNEPGNENSLSGNVIVSLCIDSENDLWIGTYNEGLTRFDGRNFTRYGPIPGDSLSLPSRNIWEIFEDSKKRLWVGTPDAGAGLFDKNTGEFHRLRIWGPNALQSVVIDPIAEDRHGNIWFGTAGGIDVLSADGARFTHYEASADPNSLSNNGVFDIRKDSKGRLWIGTFDGLNLFDEEINGFRVYRENPVHNAVLAVQEDSAGHIWMSTLNGLYEMTFPDEDVNNVAFKRYTESDGLQSLQFNPGCTIKTRRGELVFGGPAGFNIINGDTRKKGVAVNKIVFTELELYEKPVKIGEKVNGVVVLGQSIAAVSEIVFPPNKNFFSVKFSALNFFHPERVQYSYKLEGLTSEWLPVDAKKHEIVFNSLNPGNYKLRVRAANGDRLWGRDEATLSIVIQPPFWKTRTAFALYAVALVGILIVARKVIQQREQLKFALEQERHEIQRIHDLDVMKVKFFTNVSHEFRTPLTLILTPIDKLIKKATDPDQMTQFQLIQRNGKRLMNLVNQLLDFKKLEVQDIKFNPSEGDIIAYVRDTVWSFSDLSEKKNIKLLFNSSEDRLETLFDHDKLEKILFNLLSNAIKFTLENGVVSVNAGLVKEGDDRLLQIEVNDTGIGIPQDKLDKIFEPFFQTDLPKSIVNQGSGIGLAITKEFVRIHGGCIKVDSEVGKGSSFKVRLPVREIPEEVAVQPDNTTLPGIGTRAPGMPAPDNGRDTLDQQSGKVKKKSLLLVDDNDDFRFYLKDNLKFLYTIYEARNGAEGWDQVLSVQPDLIVSDIMMPEMNGIELCSKIKSDERVSHIPVILLTARSSEEQRLEGFKTGADDYITKPFNFEILEARINNLLRQRAKFQNTFRKTLDVKSSELQITPLDVKFIENAVKCVEEHVSTSDFSVEDLGAELGISRAYVFKKIHALTGKTPLEFIRTIRLQHAAQLLEKSQLSVREVAYKVGFNNPKYFTKYFKEQFHMLPSDYADSKKKEE